MSWKKISAIGGAILMFFSLIGGVYGAYRVVAFKSDVREVSMRLDLKILQDRVAAIQEQLWAIEDRYGDDCENAPSDIKRRYKKLKYEMDSIQKKIDAIIEHQAG